MSVFYLSLLILFAMVTWCEWVITFMVLFMYSLCIELIAHPEKSYQLQCVVMWDLETSEMRGLCPALGRISTEKKNYVLSALLNEYEIIFERCETLNCTAFCMKGQRISMAGVP